MEASGGDGSVRQSLFSDPHADPAVTPSWAYLHKPIIAIVMGALVSAVGAALLLILRSSGTAEETRSVASACLSVGLMFVVVGLVWIPVLKEKLRRKRCSHGA